MTIARRYEFTEALARLEDAGNTLRRAEAPTEQT
jgi:hypothetical protein